MNPPKVSRMHVPDGYGLPKDSALLEWSDVSARIGAANHYWITTIDAEGNPNPRPIDAVWLDERLYLGGDPSSRWQRNLAANPKASINLEDGDRATIMQGRATVVRPDRELATRIVALSNAQYGFDQTIETWEGRPVGMFSPTVVLAWDEVLAKGTRFEFG